MKITIPKVIIQVPLKNYAAELNGHALHVWVNPPMDKLDEYNRLVTELQERQLESARQVLAPESEKKETPLQRALEQMTRWLKIKKEQPADSLDDGLLKWYADLWSYGPEDTRWTAAELRTLEGQDPAFLSWMISQTWAVRNAHIEQKKKV